MAGYVVYRSPTSRGPFEEVAELSDRYGTAWVDRGLGDLRVFYYRVASRNAAGSRTSTSGPWRRISMISSRGCA